MKTTKRLATLVASTILVAGFSQTVLATTATATTTTKAPATAAAPKQKQKAVKTIAWTSLTASQKSILSRLEQVWTTIPVDKQKGFITSADNWKKASAEDQKKVIAEMDSYLPAKK